jgi:hypothetical protein
MWPRAGPVAYGALVEGVRHLTVEATINL